TYALNQETLVLIEIGGWSPAMIVLDAMEKTAGVRVLQAELNDRPGVCLKLHGTLGDVQAAASAAGEMARAMQIEMTAHVIPAPAEGSNKAYQAAPEYNPLIEQRTVHDPAVHDRTAQNPEKNMKNQVQASFAVGLIETQGFTAVFEAI